MVGRSRAPMRFILLAFESIVNIPSAEDVVRTIRPWRFVKMMFSAISIVRIEIDRYL